MKIIIKCDNPSNLKNRIIEGIESNELTTWRIHNSEKGKTFTFTAAQYKEKAYIFLKPDESNKNNLIGRVVKMPKLEKLEYEIKTIFICHFVQAILNHYPEYFDSIEITH